MENSWVKQWYESTDIHDLVSTLMTCVKRKIYFRASSLYCIFQKNVDKYITCIYFVTILLTKTGTGDIFALNIHEQIYISITMISAIFLTGIFIGEIWNFLNSTTVGRVKYDYRINELKQFVKNNKISKFQLKKLWRYVKQLWFVSSGHQVR